MDPEKVLSYLQKIPFFTHLSHEQLVKIASLLKYESHESGTTVIEEGVMGDKAYILIHGLVQIYKTDETGKEITIAFRSDGDILGEMALIDDKPRSASAKTMKPTEFLIIPKKIFLSLLHKDATISLEIIHTLVHRIRDNAQTIEISTKELLFRAYDTLVTLSQHFPNHDVHISQEELAHIVGATRPRVTEVLSQLQTEKKIIISSRKIHVL